MSALLHLCGFRHGEQETKIILISKNTTSIFVFIHTLIIEGTAQRFVVAAVGFDMTTLSPVEL
jgi:hypothetical protein